MCLSPGKIRMVGDSMDTLFLLRNDPVLGRVAKAPSMNEIHWVKWNVVCSHALSKTRTQVVGEKSSQPGYYKDKSTVEIILRVTQTHRALPIAPLNPVLESSTWLKVFLPSLKKTLYWWKLRALTIVRKNLSEKSVQLYISKRLFLLPAFYRSS